MLFSELVVVRSDCVLLEECDESIEFAFVVHCALRS
jgi:hypothetical protein